MVINSWTIHSSNNGDRTMKRQRDAILRNGRKVKQLRLTDFPKETRSLSAGSKDQTPS